MPSNLPSVSPLGNSGPPVAPSGAADAPSQSLVRITPSPGAMPVGPSVDAPVGSPLERSGLNLLDLLDTTDVLVERTDTPPVALEVGLERARGALLRNLPGDALAALDQIWEGARRTEEGWYLRSGALTVLGLPAESERVSQEGLGARPTSTALRFLQSLARVAMGDLVGARSTLQQAQLRAPADTLLQVQQAIVQARIGDGGGAQLTLDRAIRAAPEHPSVEYGKTGVRRALSDASRQRSRATPGDTDAVDAIARMRRTPAQAAVALEAVDRERREDVTAVALFRFGARMVLLPATDAATEARALLRAFSAGGMLSSVGGTEQTQAARIVLTAFAGVMGDGATDTPAPLRALVGQIVPMLCDGQLDDAARLVRRASGIGREPVGRLLQRLMDGALAAEQHATGLPGRAFSGTPSMGSVVIPAGTPARSMAIDLTTLAANSGHGTGGDDPTTSSPETPTSARSSQSTQTRPTPPHVSDRQIRGEGERSPLIPVRLGLALLEETSQSRAAARAIDVDTLFGRRIVPGDSGSELRIDSVDLSSRRSGPNVARIDADAYARAYANAGVFVHLGDDPMVYSSGERLAAGWGAARAVHALSRPDGVSPSATRAATVILIIAASAAMSTGHALIAFVCGIGALLVGARHIRDTDVSRRRRATGMTRPDGTSPTSGRDHEGRLPR